MKHIIFLRDWLGDNSPPDKLNNASEAGLDFGFPYFNGRDLPDQSVLISDDLAGVIYRVYQP